MPLQNRVNPFGAILADLGPQATVRATAAQADDKFVIAGSRGSNALLARYEAGGAIDLTFGNDGVMWLDLGIDTGAVMTQGTQRTDTVDTRGGVEPINPGDELLTIRVRGWRSRTKGPMFSTKACKRANRLALLSFRVTECSARFPPFQLARFLHPIQPH